MTLEGKKVLVVGLGESGRAAARFLVRNGAAVSAADLRPEAGLAEAARELRDCGVRAEFGGHRDELFLEQDLIVPSPGVPWDLPQLEAARRKGIAVWGELELAAGRLAGRKIAVTGTNGKTTTTAWIAHVLQTAGFDARPGGNIGRPVLSMIEESRDESWSVLELSSFQLEASRSFRPDIAVVLNVTPDHLDRHHDMESYAAAKARIFERQSGDDVLAVNDDDAICRGFAARAPGRVWRFSRLRAVEPGVWAEQGSIRVNGEELLRGELPLRGPHNLENALATVSACVLAGAPKDKIAGGLLSFRAVEHRMEFVSECRGVAYYNDSKATNVDAALKALESFDRGVWMILGGQDKGADFRPLREPLRKRARAALLIGAAAEKIARELDGCVEVRECGTLGAAVRLARESARPGETVLLAPACASFDQFENYGHRGRAFKQLICGGGG